MSTPGAIELRGRCVMLVEDELLVAMLIEDALTEQGCSVIGPYTSVADALAAATRTAPDIAVLDVNLRGERVYPVAETLAKRGIPFLLLSGYGTDAVPPAHPDWTACSKPFRAHDLIAALERLLIANASPRTAL